MLPTNVDPACRQREVVAIQAQMQRAVDQRTPRLVRITGPPGFGKTTLLRAVVSWARGSGWVALSVACNADSRGGPLAVLLDLTSAAFRELGDAGEAYAKGLTRALTILRVDATKASNDKAPVSSLSSVPPEVVLSRLLEGITFDRPLLIAIDDAQLVPTEAARALRYIHSYLGEAPLCLVIAQRDDAPVQADLPACNVELSLAPLPHDEAYAIALREFPDGHAAVLEAIVDQARGSPADLVLLASQARADGAASASDVSTTLHTKIARDLATMDDETRKFLQYCALIGEPVDQRILHQLYPDQARLAVLIASSRKYVTKRNGALEFLHDYFPVAVRASVTFERPLRKDIIAALIALDRNSLDDYQRIVDHAEAIDDLDIAYDYATRLAETAYVAKHWEQAANGYRRALSFRWPPSQEYPSFFRRYAASLRLLARDAEAEAVIIEAIRHGKDIRLPEGLGRLAATLISIQAEREDTEHALATFDSSVKESGNPSDTSEILDAVARIYAYTVDERRFAEITSQLESIPAVTPLAMASLHVSQALLQARLGRHEAARTALCKATTFMHNDRSALGHSLPLIERFVDFQEHGCRVFRVNHDDLSVTLPGYWTYLNLVSDFACGRWNAVDARFDQLNLERFPAVQQALLLAVPAAMAAMSDHRCQPPAAKSVLEHATVRGFGPSTYQLAAWMLAGTRESRPPELDTIMPKVLSFRKRPLGVELICFTPVALALFAGNFDRALAEELAGEDLPECSRWLRAQFDFSRGYSCANTAPREGEALLRDAARQFESLGASFFAAFASGCAHCASPEQRTLLERLHVRSFRGAALHRKTSRSATRHDHGLTSREMQVAQLVAEGKRNREIAQLLFLSERTVEVHLANVFAKLNVTSRTQLARYIRE